MGWPTSILNWESSNPESLTNINFSKAHKIQFERAKWKIIVNISYSAWTCNIKKILLSEEEKELVESRESRWFILVGFTDETGIVPKYVTDAIKIEEWNINLQLSPLREDKFSKQKLVFVKNSAINLVCPESVWNRFRRMINGILNY